MPEQKSVPSLYVIPGIIEKPDFRKRHTKQLIEGVVCSYFKISRERLHMKSRELPIVEPRMISQYLMYHGVMGETHKGIAYYFGYSDKSSIGGNINRVQNLIDTEPAFANKVNEIILILNERQNTHA